MTKEKSQITKKCHYVPKFYLNNFSINEKIYAYKRNGEIIEKSTYDIAIKNNFYTTEDKKTGKKTDDIEKIFEKLENVSAPIIQRIIETEEIVLSDEQKARMIELVSNLYTRNLYFQDKLKNMLAGVSEMQAKMLAQNKKILKLYLAKRGHQVGDKQLEILRKKIFDPKNKVKITGGEKLFLKNAITLSLDFLPIIATKKWNLLISKTERIFVTSDNPVILVPPINAQPGQGLGLANANIFLPISPKLGVLLTNEELELEKMMLNRKQVDSCNNHLMFYADRFLFSNLRSKDINERYLKTDRETSKKILIQHPFKLKKSDKKN